MPVRIIGLDSKCDKCGNEFDTEVTYCEDCYSKLQLEIESLKSEILELLKGIRKGD